MTALKSPTPEVTVTQEDREAAWQFHAECYGGSNKQAWMAGKYDGNRAVQAFARHRLAASTPGAEGCNCARRHDPEQFDHEKGCAHIATPPAAVERGEVAREDVLEAIERNWNHGPDALADAILSALSRDGGEA